MLKDREQIAEMGRKACRQATDSGAGHADVLVQDGRSVSVEIEKNSVRTGEVSYDSGYSVRAFHEGGAGYARGSGLDDEAVAVSGKDAAAMAREAEPDPDFKALPGPAEAEPVDQLFEPEAADFEPARAIEMGHRSIETAREIDSNVIVKGAFEAGAGVSALVNSNGVCVVEKDSFISYYVFSVVRRGDRVGSYYEYSHARRLEDLRPVEEVAREATERAVSFLDSRKMESGEYPVVLGPLAAMSFMRSVTGAASAEEIQRGRSYMQDRRGEKIGSNAVTVEENPLVPAGLHSSAFDGEGVPRKRRLLIDSGVLTTYLHNSYTANKAGEENTGHASRGSYGSGVGISTTNLTIRPGSRTEKDITGGISDGLYVFMGSLSPHPVTGQISGTVDFGFRIKNGELSHPVENVMLGGEVFGVLGAIEEVSSDYREEPGNIMPSMLIGKMKVAGS